MAQDPNPEYEFRLQEEVGALAIDYELESHSAFDRTVRACPWLSPGDESAFYRLRPFHKDARVVVARERGFETWRKLAGSLSPGHCMSSHGEGLVEPEFDVLCRTAGIDRVLEAADRLDRNGQALSQPILLAIEAGREIDLIEGLLGLGFGDPEGLGSRRALHTGRTDASEVLAATFDPPALTDADVLLGACAQGDKAEAWSWLFRSPSILSDIGSFERAAMALWADLGLTHALAILLDLGAQADWPSLAGALPLHYAAAEGRPEIVAMLLSACSPVQPRDLRFSSTPLGWAVHGAAGLRRQTLMQELGERKAVILSLRHAGALVMPGYIDRAPSELLESLTGPL